MTIIFFLLDAFSPIHFHHEFAYLRNTVPIHPSCTLKIREALGPKSQ